VLPGPQGSVALSFCAAKARFELKLSAWVCIAQSAESTLSSAQGS
jgi:hypothetical protein